MTIQDYLNQRVENQILYFESKSKKNKEYYLMFKVAQLTSAALLPFFSVFITQEGPIKYIVAFLGTVVAILEGVLAVGKYHEKWTTYRSTAEALQQEKYLFLMQTGSYVKEDSKQLFVSKIEFLLAKENAGWQQMILKEKKENGDQPSPSPSQNAIVFTPATPAASANGSSSSQPVQPAPTDPLTGVNSDSEETEETEMKDNAAR